MLLKKYNVPPFSYTHGGKHHGGPHFPFRFSIPFLFSRPILLSNNKKYVYGRKEVAQGLFDGGVRRTFCGEKEMYVALMAEPTFSQFSKFMPVSYKRYGGNGRKYEQPPVPIGRWLPDITSAAGIRRPYAFG